MGCSCYSASFSGKLYFYIPSVNFPYINQAGMMGHTLSCGCPIKCDYNIFGILIHICGCGIRSKLADFLLAF
jgi:hypothetical protein